MDPELDFGEASDFFYCPFMQEASQYNFLLDERLPFGECGPLAPFLDPFLIVDPSIQALGITSLYIS